MPSPNPSRKREGDLANAFVCTANIDAHDGGAAIIEGNRKVLAARLSDAKFFYDTDLKVPLAEQARKLDRIVFHEKLGTVADKVDRVAKLARWLVEEGIVSPSPRSRGEGRGEGPYASRVVLDDPAQSLSLTLSPEGEREKLADLADRAARLCKADLVTGMVGEFPELQGLMGGYYAAAQGEDPAVAAAIRDHYKPVGQGDAVPTDPVTVAVSLADKLDSLISFFAMDMAPTGSKDPFALRRSALGCISTIVANGLAFPLSKVISHAIRTARERGNSFVSDTTKTRQLLLDFFADRLKVQQREAGVRHDLIDAVFALGGEDDLVRLLARVHALQAFIGTADGANLLAGYKRAANILKKEGFVAPPLPGREGLGVGRPEAGGDISSHQPTPNPSLSGRGEENPLSYTPEPAETALATALDSAEPAAAAAIEAEDFERAMAALATLRAPIDQFFETVIVNDPDAAKRAARLALLDRVRAAVHTVADFSKIEG